MSVLPSHPAADLFPMMGDAEIASLAEDIRKNGLVFPIVTHDGMVLDGRNRLAACQRAGVVPRYDRWKGDAGQSPTAWVLAVNLHRRHLDTSQRAMVAARALPMFEEEARKRQEATRAVPGRQVPQAPANLPGPMEASRDDDSRPLAPPKPPREAREDAAALVNVSPRSVQDAKKVIEHGAPELVAAVETGKASVSAAAVIAEAPKAEQAEIVARGEREILKAAQQIRAAKTETRRTERMENLAEIAANAAPLAPDAIGRFPVIYADPPWRYEHAESESRAIENQYPTMALDEICALPVADLATDDAVLFMWATSPKLAESLRVVEAWGFSYRTCMVWDKERLGMGYWARQQHELLLICTRGAPPTPAPSVRPASVQRILRPEKHSAKPHEFYVLIETMFPLLQKVELFCRSPREGWSVWGNQSAGAAAK